MTSPESNHEAGQRLATLGHRLTAQRVVILEALRLAQRTVTAQELFESLRVDHPYLGRATVFRNVDALVDVGLAQRFERSGHVYAYASCSPEHHHHLVCSRCARAIEVEEIVVLPLVEKLHETYGFSVEHSALDFYGVCGDCAAAADGGATRR
ncbi:MAG: Fur family transcriptional regulator [Candidatus Dormibacteria bacterium]